MKSFKIYNTVLIIAILAIASFLTISIFFGEKTDKLNENQVIENRLEGYNPQCSNYWPNTKPIHIYGDNWSATSLDYIQVRAGTENDPHIIENATIDAMNSTYGIKIENSDEYYTIKNCTIYNASETSAAINIRISSNGKVIDNLLYDNYGTGLMVDMSSEFLIEGNHIHNISLNSLTGHGIYVEGSSNIVIHDNLIHDLNGTNADGINVWSSSNINITENEIYNVYEQRSGIYLSRQAHTTNIFNNTVYFSGYGVKASGNSNYNHQIFENILYDNRWSGISLTQTIDNKVFNNTLHDQNTGISLLGSGTFGANNTEVYGNLVYNNRYYGIRLESGSTNNIIYKNTFSNPGATNAEDNGVNTTWDNGVYGNNWSDYIGSDLDDNLIGDIPYDISGSSNNEDIKPLKDDGDHVPPEIILLSEINNTEHSDGPIDVELELLDFYGIDQTWYKIVGYSNNISFTGESFAIDQTAWDKIDGESFTIKVYANDTAGHLSEIQIQLSKQLTDSDNDDKNKTEKDEAAIPGPSIPMIVITLFCAISIELFVLNKRKSKKFRDI